MKKSNTCPKCGCTEIIKKAKVLVPQGNVGDFDKVHIQTESNPEALLLKGKKREQVNAYVCRECGFTELYVSFPEEL